ncbi:O-antigen ligase family protein [Bacillus sp. UNCCL81]|uniref:O-antigen ligase family protein n=1 Tax=Bacillus sp. UNCCL81 TaxID=1502755 RepID=UPI0008E9BEB3|nr:O-antigen ligase family protein [Bacillus sp. UNCCL81]SFD09998.1 O-antigen ligase [Bacillus sp. UNCCL81]
MKQKTIKIFLYFIDIFLVLGTIPFLTKFNNNTINNIIHIHQMLYYTAIYLCLLLFIGSTFKGDKKFTLPLSLMLFFIYIFIQSAIFSNSRIDSLYKIVILLGTCVYALSLIKRYRFGEIIKISMWGSLIVNLVTLAFIIFEPNLAFEGYKDQLVLSGSFPNKNNFATYMIFSVIINLIYLRGNSNIFKKILGLMSLITSAIFLFMSDSVTSVVTLVLIVIIYYINKLLRNKLNIVNVGLFINLSVIFIIKLQSIFEEYFLQYLGRDLTFTGRTYIWDAIISQTGRGLIFGYGYGTFWGYNPLLEQSIISNYSGYIGGVIVSGSHNGFLELMLQIGIIGTMIFIGILIYSGMKLRKIKDKNFYQFSSFYYIYILIYFITERSLWNMGYQTLFLFLIILVTLDKSSKSISHYN